MFKKLLVSVCALLLMSACSDNSSLSKTEEYVITGFPGISEKGIYHHTRDQTFDKVYFYDFENDVDVPLCSKVNCNHNNKECDAYKLSYYKSEELPLHQDPVFYGDRLYFFYENMGKGIVTLCSSDIDGSNRKEITSFKENSMIESSMFYQNKLWYTSNTFTVDEKGKIATRYDNNYETQVLDLATNETSLINDVKTSALYFLGSTEDHIILLNIDNGHKEATLTLESMESSKFERNELEKDTNTYNSFIVQGKQYYFNKKDQYVYEKNLKDLSVTKLMNVDVPKDHEVFSYNNSTNGIMELLLAKDKKVAGSIYIDLSEKKKIDTDKTIFCKADGSYFTLNEDQTISRLKNS